MALREPGLNALSGEALRDRLRQMLDARAPEAPVSEERWRARALAAVRESFRPHELAEHFRALGDDAEVLPGTLGERHWTLKDDVRRATLERLVLTGELPGLLARTTSTSPTQALLEGYLRGDVPPIETMDAPHLAAAVRVTRWLDGIKGFDVPPPATVQRELRRRALMEPFGRLAGANFQGRRRELALLSDFVGTLPVGSAFRWLQRSSRRLFSMPPSAPLFLHGPGGTGKSSLIARFILDHTEARSAVPFAYLDLDRPTLSFRAPADLLAEAAAQIALQDPDPDHWNEFHDRRSDAARAGRSREALAAGLLTSFFTHVTQTTARISLDLQVDSSRPLLLVFDTFEEAQYRGARELRAARRFLQTLTQGDHAARVILSGRAPEPSLAATQVPVGPLDPDAAAALLRRLGVRAEDAPDIFEMVGGNPLSLKLAAEVVTADAGTSGLETLQTRRYLLFRAPEQLIQGQLYRRILDHLHDDDVRKLAHPGLVMRWITADIIQQVLAAPCRVPVASPKRAAELYTELERETSLVQADHQEGVLRHRPEVRQVMLKLLQQDRPGEVHEIHVRAADYFRGDPGPAGKAERLYHLLMLDSPPSILEGAWEEAHAPYLVGAIDELPLRARSWLLARLGWTASHEVRQAADDRTELIHLANDVRGLLASEDPRAALETLSGAGDLLAAPELALLEVTALRDLGEVDRAGELLRGLQARSRPPAPEVSRACLELARQYFKTGQVRIGLAWVDDAATLAAPDDPLAALEQTVLRGRALPREWEAELLTRLSSTPDAALASAPTIVREALFVVGPRPELVERALRVVTLPALGFGEARALADALASWDGAGSGVPALIAAALEEASERSPAEAWFSALRSDPHRASDALRIAIDKFGLPERVAAAVHRALALDPFQSIAPLESEELA